MKTLVIHAGLNAYKPASTAKQVLDSDQRQGYFGHSFHWVIDRKGNTTPGRSTKLPAVRLPVTDSKTSISVLLLGGWSESGPVSDFTSQQWDAVIALYRKLRGEGLITDTVRVFSPVPDGAELQARLNG